MSHLPGSLLTPQAHAIPHSLKAPSVRLVHLNLLEINAPFLRLVLQLCRVEHAVAAPGFDHERLLVQTEVGPGEIWRYYVAVEREDFVVADCAGVGEVVDSEAGGAGEE